MPDFESNESGLMVPAAFAEQRRRGIRPEMREVASTADGRDITRGMVDPMLIQPPTDSVLRLRGATDYRLYKEVLRDDQVSSTLQQRRLAVTSREWEVMPGGKSAADKAAADFLREQLNSIRFDAITGKMLFGIFYGFAVAECLWARDGRHIVIDQIKVRDRARFGFDGLNRLRLKTMSNPNGELLEDRKFWCFQTGSDHDDEPYGLGLAHWLYWPVFFKRNGMKFWLIFLEKFGQPTAKGSYPANASDYERQRLLAALEAISTDAGVIVPEGMQIDLIEAARSGTADYTSLYDRMDKAIAKVVLGQTASTEGTAGKLGNEELQGDVRLELVKADADLVCQSFNLSVAKWLTEWNYPNANPPMVWRKVEDPEDLNQVAERYERLHNMGFRPTEAHFKEVFGGEWETVQPVAEPAPGDPASFAEKELEDAVEQQVQQLAKVADGEVANMADRIRSVLNTAESLEAFAEQLADLFPALDPQSEAFADVMAQAMLAANMAGRFDITDEMGSA